MIFPASKRINTSLDMNIACFLYQMGIWKKAAALGVEGNF